MDIAEYIECDFCNELNGKNNLYWEIAEKCNLPRNRMIYEGEHWVVWPTIGAIVPGYVLIVSKKHHLSLMDCDFKEIIELENLLKQTRRVLENIYHYPCIAFEHGSGCGIGNKPSCIDHCHLHILPLEEDIYNRIDLEKFQIDRIDSLNSLLKRKKQRSSYLLYQNHEEQFFVLYSDIYISQYFRQLIGISKGVSEKWNWRHNYFSDNIKTTINDINSKWGKGMLDYNL